MLDALRRELERSFRREQQNDSNTSNSNPRLCVNHRILDFCVGLFKGTQGRTSNRCHSGTSFGSRYSTERRCQSLKPNPIHGAITAKTRGVKLKTPRVKQFGTKTPSVKRSSRPSRRLISRVSQSFGHTAIHVFKRRRSGTMEACGRFKSKSTTQSNIVRVNK